MPVFITNDTKPVRAFLSVEGDLTLFLVVTNKEGKQEPVAVAYIDEETGALHRVRTLPRQRDLLREHGIAVQDNGKIELDNE